MVVFQFSLGSITWIYVAEICQEKAVSLSLTAMSIVTILVALVTPSALKDGTGWLFFVFALFMVAAGFWAIFHLKETKGLTAQEIENLYKCEEPKKEKDLEEVPLLEET